MNKFPIKLILKPSLYIGLLSASVLYTIFSYLQKDGISILECSFNSFFSGIILLILCLFVPIFSINKKLIKEELFPIKAGKLFIFFIFILLLGNIIYIALDYLIFFFDNSISKDISEALIKIPGTENFATKTEILKLRNFPLAIINWVSNLFFGFIGILISYFIVKKKLQYL
ncbi:MAG: hypothetical protein ACK5UE_11450 [Chitinophagales bacterium]|jgi:hypothetical protein